MKKLLLLIPAMVLSFALNAQVFFSESFEDTTGWSITNLFDDGFEDYVLNDSVSIINARSSGPDFTIVGADSTHVIAFEDINSGDPGSAASGGVVTVTVDSINIGSKASLLLTLAAAGNPTSNRYDYGLNWFGSSGNGDTVIVEVSIDGGPYAKIMQFCSDTSAGGGGPNYSNNGPLYNDANLNYVGGESGEIALDDTLQDFSASITGTGLWLSVRIQVRVESGDEEFVMDNLRISGVNSCNQPSSLMQTSSGTTTAEITWTTGGSTMWNIEYGPAGFTQGNGTMVTATTSNPLTITGLSPANAYAFYVQDTCTGIGTSAWSGPAAFVTSTVPVYPISTIHTEDANGVADSSGVYCMTYGIVQSLNFRSSGVEFFLNDGSNNAGIQIRNTSYNSYTPVLGDSMLVRGTVGQFAGLTQFSPDTIMVLSSGAMLPTPLSTSMLDETTEGLLLEISGVTLVDPSQWPTSSGSSVNVDIETPAGDTLVMRIDSDTDIDGVVPVPTGSFTVTGVGGQFDFSSPHDEGYQILPRFQQDILVSYSTVFINEIGAEQDSLIQDPSDNNYDDWVEIFNPGNDTVDIANFRVSDGTNTTTLPFGTNATKIAPSSHLILWADTALSAGNNHLGFELASAGHLQLIRPDSVIMDSITYPSLGNNESFGRYPDGGPMWVVYKSAMSAPTPGGMNAAPPPPILPQYPISLVTTDDANGEPDSIGVMCILQGIVTSPDFDGNNGFSFHIQDSTGGINIFNFNDVSGYTVREGDELRCFGEIDFFNGLTELFVDSIHVLDSGLTLPAPAVVTTFGNFTESELITIHDVYLVDGSQWPAPGGFSTNFDIVTPAGDTLIMRVDTDVDVEDSILTAPSGNFSITGIGGQFDPSAPHTDNYQIFPRHWYDIDTTVCEMATNLMVDSVDSVSAMVSWDATNASTWNIRWGLGTTPTDSVMGLTAAMYTITGLMSDTTYNVWVQAVCGTKPATAWTSPEEFTTDPSPVGVNDPAFAKTALKVYPNPVDGHVLHFNKEIDYQLINTIGQVVEQGHGTSVDMNMESGIYLLQASTGEVIKVIVK